MRETVLNQARNWGFVCEEDNHGIWRIFPHQITERWKMQLVGDRWLLMVGDIPQINLHPHEAIAFLERHRY